MRRGARTSVTTCIIFFNDTATTEIYTLSLHDALPISWSRSSGGPEPPWRTRRETSPTGTRDRVRSSNPPGKGPSLGVSAGVDIRFLPVGAVEATATGDRARGPGRGASVS